MSIQRIIVLGCAALALAGCSTAERGGTGPDYNTTTGYGEGAYPEPAGSPTFYPGMNPRDIRDPNALTRPEPPSVSTPTAPPTAPPRMRQGSTP